MPSLAAVAKDLQEQWELLRTWLDELPDAASSEPSSLPGWSIGILVAHLGRNLSALAACRPAPSDEEPHSISSYLAIYRTVDPAHIDVNARAHAQEIAADPLGRLDDEAEQAFAHLADLQRGDGDDLVVVTRNGDSIGLTDFAVTRLLEMVVHAYDLAPILPLPAPVDPTARTIIAECLITVLEERTGYRLDVGNEAAWILAATGRTDWATAVARGAVQPSAISDGTPELGSSLPLL